jgi:hypothetical protein
MFEIGQQVICINGEFSAKDRYWIKNLPVAGTYYTISDIESGKRGQGLRLSEVPNAEIPVLRKTTGETFQFLPTFLAERFRATTDISAFREMLSKEPAHS